MINRGKNRGKNRVDGNRGKQIGVIDQGLRVSG
jgi:hypothetical protein